MHLTVSNPPAVKSSAMNHLLMIAYKSAHPNPVKDPSTRCRFELFVRLKPGVPSPFKDQKRTWCYRGDKYTDEPHKMLRNLLRMVEKQFTAYEILILSDNDQGSDEKTVLKIVSDTIQRNQLHQYALMLSNFKLPEFLKITV